MNALTAELNIENTLEGLVAEFEEAKDTGDKVVLESLYHAAKFLNANELAEEINDCL